MSDRFTARMISSDTERECAPLLRTQFTLASGHGDVVRADLHTTALGICEARINGRAAAPDLLTPGWTSYEWRLRYVTWDVTDLLAEENTIGVLIGHGWHSGHLGFGGKKAVYGAERAALVELRIHFADGHTQTVVTDETWRAGPSDVLSDDLYHGQTIDARLRDDSWTRPDADLSRCSGVTVLDFAPERLTPYIAPPVLRQQNVSPLHIWKSPASRTLVDFGQNLVGWTRLATRGEPGQTITIRHAEVLENDELGTRPLRTARATDTFILSGDDDVFEPTFTFHGFRYAEVDGWAGTNQELRDALTAVVIGTEMDRIGHFECSDQLLNQLHSNIVWGMRGNFVDLPTDCPQRDERLGWTGDLSTFIDTAVYLYDVGAFLRDWLLDLAAEQSAGGYVPIVVPDNIKYEDTRGLGPDPQAGGPSKPVMALWSDAACWVPWALWEAYGDRAVLEQQYPSMAAHARSIGAARGTRGVMEGGVQLGDWLDPTAPPDEPYKAKSDPWVVATACVYRSVRIAADTARLLGREADAEEFDALTTELRTAFNREFVDCNGRIRSDGAAVYALAISFGLLDADSEHAAGERLAELVAESGFHVVTGFAGTPFLLPALTRTGHLETAYRLLLQTECPSWLYPVTMGATTVWERWDSMLPDGSINPGEMTSFNHYAFGAVGNWMHRVIAGLSPLEPGYRRILFAPQPGGGLTTATGSVATPHGTARISWSIDNDELRVDIDVPPGTQGVLRLPASQDRTLPPGRHQATCHLATSRTREDHE